MGVTSGSRDQATGPQLPHKIIYRAILTIAISVSLYAARIACSVDDPGKSLNLMSAVNGDVFRDQDSSLISDRGVVVMDGTSGMAPQHGEDTGTSKRKLAPEIPAPLPTLRNENWPQWEETAKIERPVAQDQSVFELPPEAKTHSHWTLISFVVCVALPLALATYYYAFVASNQYVSEFRFAVTDAKTSSPPVAAGGLTALLGAGPTSEGLQNYIVVDYLTSPQAVEDISTKVDVLDTYSRPDADWVSRFNRNLPKERFIAYWRSMVDAKYDPSSGLATAQVRAFTPQDSLRIADELVALSEALVNKIALRSQQDAVKFAEAEVKRAEARLTDLRTEMTKYRIAEGVIDPLTNVVASNIQLANTLRATLSQLQADYGALGIQQTNSNAPAARLLQARINATKEELRRVEREVANSREGNEALAKVVAQYEKLDLERQYAQSMMLSTMQALDQARANAASQHLYLTPYVRPVLAESSTYPRRLFSVIAVGVASFLIWLIGLFVIRTIQEHAV